jgi:uncharacterized protein with HEPN domain
MKKKSILSRLNDIVRAIDGAAETVGGVDFETFQSVFYMARTVERCVEIVSEATRHIPDNFKSRHPEIAWSQIAGIGNVLRHDYDSIDQQIIWEVATKHFPQLRAVVLELKVQLSNGE